MFDKFTDAFSQSREDSGFGVAFADTGLFLLGTLFGLTILNLPWFQWYFGICRSFGCIGFGFFLYDPITLNLVCIVFICGSMHEAVKYSFCCLLHVEECQRPD